jgi:biopolymer transport protein ExbD
MIDVTFLLLLFFILTFTFRQMEGQLPGALPGPDRLTAKETLRRPIHLRIHPAGAAGAVYELTGAAEAITSPRALHAALRARRRILTGRTPVSIEPAGNVRWQYAVEALNQAVRAGFNTISFPARSTEVRPGETTEPSMQDGRTS